jgi:hypothetical protein
VATLLGQANCNPRRTRSFVAESIDDKRITARIVARLNGRLGMQRRDFLKAGIAGTALSLAQGAARAEDAPATPAASATGEDLGQNVVVISVDGSTLSSEMVDKYKRNGADVWLFDGPRTLPRFSRAFEFLDRESSRITLCRSHKEILAAKRDGKVAMVFGWQDSEALEERVRQRLARPQASADEPSRIL